jgi:hypothetical protein
VPGEVVVASAQAVLVAHAHVAIPALETSACYAYCDYMNTLPDRSPGVLVSALTDRSVAYDIITETAHILNPTAGMLLAACNGVTEIDCAVAAWAEATGFERTVIAADVEDGLATLQDLGLDE